MMAMDNKAVIAILFCVIFASSLLVTLAFAQTTIPKPSVPEFTLNYVDSSYDVPTTTTSTTDPYTNKTTSTTYPGYHVQEFNITLAIKNQPFPATINGNKSNIYYDVQIYPHFANWTENYPQVKPESVTPQSSSEYTEFNYAGLHYPSGAQVDFRVRAILGYAYTYNLQGHIIPITQTDFIYETSNWSNAQTITIPETSTPSPSPTPTSTPTQQPPSTSSPRPPSESPSPVVTSTPIQPNIVVNLNWFYVTLAAMAGIIGFLLGVIIMQKRNKKGYS
jgi:hypothetical protein